MITKIEAKNYNNEKNTFDNKNVNIAANITIDKSSITNQAYMRCVDFIAEMIKKYGPLVNN